MTKLHLASICASLSLCAAAADDVSVRLPFGEYAEQLKCDLEWTDPKPETGGTTCYCVRGEQENGELVWVGPTRITYKPSK